MQIKNEDFKNNSSILLNIDIQNDKYDFSLNIADALKVAQDNQVAIDEQITESIDNINKLTPECDKLDYILAAASGALCGIIDIFLIGKPGESTLGELTDKWYDDRTKNFAKMCGWNENTNDSHSSAIKYLEKRFKIPYDQRGAGDAASWVFYLNPSNHHFKSLGHNPTLLGLFFSILDQFYNTSHFVTDGELISLEQADDKFTLIGHDIPSKLFCGFINWFGHLISDISGSSGSKGRGMGIPSPIWAWTNDIIAIKAKLNISVNEFDKSFSDLALKIYKEGYDVRFQSAQTIPVIINELIVRTFYSVRRLISYFSNVPKEERSLSLLWKKCEPFSNATVKRMLTVAHGSFCLVDTGDAVARGFIEGMGSFNVAEFVMRFNIIGFARFSVSLYGETKRGVERSKVDKNVYFLKRERVVIDDYIEGLKYLADIYNDSLLVSFVEELKNSDMYVLAFEKSVKLAEKRNVPANQTLKTKADIDSFFNGGNS